VEWPVAKLAQRVRQMPNARQHMFHLLDGQRAIVWQPNVLRV
jgi:hypothetical protein